MNNVPSRDGSKGLKVMDAPGTVPSASSCQCIAVHTYQKKLGISSLFCSIKNHCFLPEIFRLF